MQVEKTVQKEPAGLSASCMATHNRNAMQRTQKNRLFVAVCPPSGFGLLKPGAGIPNARSIVPETRPACQHFIFHNASPNPASLRRNLADKIRVGIYPALVQYLVNPQAPFLRPSGKHLRIRPAV